MLSGSKAAMKIQSFSRIMEKVQNLQYYMGNAEVRLGEGYYLHGKNHFKNLFKYPKETTITKTFRMTQFFLRFSSEEENKSLMEPITVGELENVLKGMQK